MKKNIYKSIPTLAVIIAGILACWGLRPESPLFNLLYSNEVPFKEIERIIAIFIVLIFPALILSLLGNFGLKKLREGKKPLFMLWIFLFIAWMYLLLRLRAPFIIDP